jgi:hypothetical protein
MIGLAMIARLSHGILLSKRFAAWLIRLQAFSTGGFATEFLSEVPNPCLVLHSVHYDE